MSLTLLLLLPFAGSALAACLPTRARNLVPSVAGLVGLAILVPVALLFPEVRDGGVVVERIVWLPSLGLDLVVRIDGFAWLFAMLVSGIGVLVVAYSRYYLSPADPARALLLAPARRSWARCSASSSRATSSSSSSSGS